MARFVVDCNVLLRIVAGEVDVHPGHELLAPTLVRSQALAALYAAARRGELSEDVARARQDRVGTMRIRLLGDGVLRRVAWRYAEELGWDDTHTAEYVALARLQGDAFVTLDKGLARQLKDGLGVQPDVSYAELEPEIRGVLVGGRPIEDA